MNPATLTHYARLGAEARVRELTDELAAIEAEFPGLAPTRAHRREGHTPARTPQDAPGTTNGARHGGKPRPAMTAAQKAAVSRRMKAYWRARRQAAGK